MTPLQIANLLGDREALAEKVHREERCNRRARRAMRRDLLTDDGLRRLAEDVFGQGSLDAGVVADEEPAFPVLVLCPENYMVPENFECPGVSEEACERCLGRVNRETP